MKHLWFEKGAYASKAARQYLNDHFNPLAVKKTAVIRHAALGDQVIVRPFWLRLESSFLMPKSPWSPCQTTSMEPLRPSGQNSNNEKPR